jgi:hypothetical protein
MIIDWIRAHAVLASPRNNVGLGSLAAAAVIALPFSAESYPLFPEEPAKEVIQSDLCVVPVCAEVDFGDYKFRYYAPDRTSRVRYIAKGTCKCSKIRQIEGDHIALSVETREDGKFAPNVSVLRIYPPGHPRKNSANMTTWEQYSRTANEYDEISDFQLDGDSLSSFRVFRSRRPRGREAYLYFFVPRSAQFNFPDREQPVAFDMPRGFPLYDSTGKWPPTVSAQVELTSSVHFFQFFSPRLIPSNDWISAMERSAEVINERLFPKAK